MANRWTDGGETPLSKTEKWGVGGIGVALVAGGVGFLAMVVISVLGLRPSAGGMVCVGAVSVMLALAWVQPWNHEPPRPRPKRSRERGTL